MDKSENNKFQGKDPDTILQFIPGVNIFMDKLVPESAENAVSAGKSKLSDSSIDMQEENEASILEVDSKTREY